MRTAVAERGVLPFDSFTLPLISPSGRYAATRVGQPPVWDAVVAEPNAPALTGARLEVYRLPQTEGEPMMTRVIVEPALLARSYDDTQFLIESPRADGSRWIGSVDWQTGQLLWLVANGFVNAFPALGPNGALAYARRDVDAEHFDLVVAPAGGARWTLPASGGDWLFPSWAGDGSSGLFVLSLRDGFLDLIYGIATTAEAFQATEQRLQLAVRASRAVAYQAVSGQSAPALPSPEPLIAFYHPARQQAAIWRPTRALEKSLWLLGEQTLSALPVGADAALVSHADELEWRQSGERGAASILSDLHLARPVLSADWPIMLLQPQDSRSTFNLVPDQTRLRSLAILEAGRREE